MSSLHRQIIREKKGKGPLTFRVATRVQRSWQDCKFHQLPEKNNKHLTSTLRCVCPTWLDLVEQRELLAGHLGSGVQVRDEGGQEGLQLGELVEVRGEEGAAAEGRGQPVGHCPRNAEAVCKSQGGSGVV